MKVIEDKFVKCYYCDGTGHGQYDWFSLCGVCHGFGEELLYAQEQLSTLGETMDVKQIVAWAYRTPVVDRHGKPVHLGDRVRVKRCTGPYGQTCIEEGVVTEQIGGGTHAQYGSVTFRTDAGKYEGAEVKYIYESPVGVCADVFDDFEHGHETWLEVLG